MQSRRIALLLLVMAGCSRSAPDRAAATAAPPATPAAPTRSPHQFDWKLSITDPAYQARLVSTAQARGDVPLGLDRWRCDYAIERDPRATDARDESGYVTCVHASTGAQIQTMTLCQETDARPSDRGTSTLRVSDPSGQLYSIDLTCKSTATKDWGPEIVELPLGASPNTGGGGVTTRASAVAPQGKPERARDRDGALHFQWKLELGSPSGTSQTVSPEAASGALPTTLAGWSCSYQIAQQQDLTFTQLEIGHVTCQSRGGDKAEAVMMCAESAERPSACNLSSLVLTDDARQRHTVLIRCKGVTNPCEL